MLENRKSLMKYRLETAEEKLDSSSVLLNAGKYKDSIGRSYYAMFSAVWAILALDGVDYSKHAGVIAYFQKEYIKTGIFEKVYSKYLSQAFQIRNQADYEDFYIVSQKDAQEQHIKAVEFVRMIKEYLKNEDLR